MARLADRARGGRLALKEGQDLAIEASTGLLTNEIPPVVAAEAAEHHLGRKLAHQRVRLEARRLEAGGLEQHREGVVGHRARVSQTGVRVLGHVRADDLQQEPPGLGGAPVDTDALGYARHEEAAGPENAGHFGEHGFEGAYQHEGEVGDHDVDRFTREREALHRLAEDLRAEVREPALGKSHVHGAEVHPDELCACLEAAGDREQQHPVAAREIEDRKSRERDRRRGQVVARPSKRVAIFVDGKSGDPWP